MVRLPFAKFPFSIDWLPDGRLLIASSSNQPLLRQEPDGSLVPHANLSRGFNEIVVDDHGNAYINGAGFNPLIGEKFAPGIIILVASDGSAKQVAEGISFPNGMAITPDNSTLIVADSYGKKLTAFTITADGLSKPRIWADLDDGVPDGICLDAEGAIWVASPVSGAVIRVREGGVVTDRIEVEHQAFACMLGGPDRRTLFLCTARDSDPATTGARTGRIETVTVDVPGAGLP
jgi:sugar lactone lactonase YvrE